ncbi:MAG TPA: hypothetical protein VHM01_01725 [Alphaproteobacteria bacterium]|nr:hypothetical protein [Alphaproteobacteria bacterium]
MSAQRAIDRVRRPTQEDFPAIRRTESPATETGLARLLVSTAVALLLATGCLGWEVWAAGDLSLLYAITTQ